MFPCESPTRKRPTNDWRDERCDGTNWSAEITRRLGSATWEAEIDEGVDDDTTTAVWAEVALLVPNWFRAETVTRIVRPTSEDDSFWVELPLPKPPQLLPFESQRSHW